MGLGTREKPGREGRIKATAPGMVVYASSEDRGNYMGDSNPIQVGTTVHERQLILSIPDPSSMGVRVNVHESAMDRVKVGLAIPLEA